MNTFGDQFFSDRKNVVLKTYFYAISDLSVGGRSVVKCCKEFGLTKVLL